MTGHEVNLRPEENWKLPQELSTSRPRAVRLTAAGGSLVAAAIGLVLAGSLVAVTTGISAKEKRKVVFALDRSGVETEGQVVALTRTRAEHPKHFVKYVFHVDDRPYAGEARISRDYWKRLKVGSAVTVQYLPSNLSVHRLPEYPRPPFPAWKYSALGAGLAFPAPFLLWILLAQRRLVADGRACAAVVTRHETAGSEAGKQRVYCYSFFLMNGVRKEGKSGVVEKPPAIGATIAVLYDPENPARSSPYPPSLVRAGL